MLGVEIVDHDEVEVGTRRHLACAEPPKRHDRGLLTAHAAVRGGEIGLDAGMQRADQQVGKSREHFAGLFRRKRTRQDAGADQEHVLLAEQPDRVEHVLVAAALAKRLGKIGLEPLGIGQRAEKARIDQRIDDVRVLRENLGKPRRGTEDERDEANKLRILPQQREQTPAGAQAGEKPVESCKGRIRIFRPRELIDDDRDQLGRDFFAPARRAKRDSCRRASAARRRRLRAAGESPFRASRSSVSLRASPSLDRKRQILLLREQGRRAFKQPDIMPLDRAQMRQQRRGEFVAVLEAEKSGKLAQRLGLGGQCVGLLVRHHLQAMLDAAQKIVGRRQLVARRLRRSSRRRRARRASRRWSGRAGLG